MRIDLLNPLIIAAVLLGMVGCVGAPTEPTATPTSVPPTDTSTPVLPAATATSTPSTPTPTPRGEGRALGEMVRSDKERMTSPDVEEGDLADLVAGNNAFAFDLYQAIRQERDNAFYSPYSVSIALAMAYAGARGETEQQMADALHFTLPQGRLHPAFNALDLELARRGEEDEERKGKKFQLNIANAVWGQAGYSFLSEYLDVLAENYGAGMRLLDFKSGPEEARKTINKWVSEQTEGKIEDLIPQGAVDTLTRLILTNAIYFNASWMYPFEEEETHDGTFHTLGGQDVTVPMMEQTERFGYAEGEGYQAVELPYVGDEISMVILLPETGQFEDFETSLGAERVKAVVEKLERRKVTLTMPKFEFDSSFQMASTLAKMGMPSAFSPKESNFSGIDGTEELFITDVVHKAFVSVDEAGTEAAAATAVVMGLTSAPESPVEVAVDRPFAFFIHDDETGAVLFVGRVVNPEA